MTNEATYVVLVNAGTDWPDVVFIGTWEEATAFNDNLDEDLVGPNGDPVSTSVQAIVTFAQALAWDE